MIFSIYKATVSHWSCGSGCRCCGLHLIQSHIEFNSSLYALADVWSKTYFQRIFYYKWGTQTFWSRFHAGHVGVASNPLNAHRHVNNSQMYIYMAFRRCAPKWNQHKKILSTWINERNKFYIKYRTYELPAYALHDVTLSRMLFRTLRTRTVFRQYARWYDLLNWNVNWSLCHSSYRCIGVYRCAFACAALNCRQR